MSSPKGKKSLQLTTMPFWLVSTGDFRQHPRWPVNIIFGWGCRRCCRAFVFGDEFATHPVDKPRDCRADRFLDAAAFFKRLPQG